jgi:DNA-binding NarL/FixJ family response regulator
LKYDRPVLQSLWLNIQAPSTVIKNPKRTMSKVSSSTDRLRLLSAIHQVARGETYLPPPIARQIVA